MMENNERLDHTNNESGKQTNERIPWDQYLWLKQCCYL